MISNFLDCYLYYFNKKFSKCYGYQSNLIINRYIICVHSKKFLYIHSIAKCLIVVSINCSFPQEIKFSYLSIIHPLSIIVFLFYNTLIVPVCFYFTSLANLEIIIVNLFIKNFNLVELNHIIL